MLKTLLTILLLAAPSVPTFAQQTPSWEFFAGYSMQRTNVRDYFKSTPIIYAVRNRYENLDGWNFSITENMNKRLGGTLELNGHYKTVPFQGTNSAQQMHSIVYGPRVSLRKSAFVPFVHILVGIAHADVRVKPTGPHLSDNSLAIAAGAGLDVNLWKGVAVRVLQAEFFHANAMGSNQNHYRAAAGIVFHVGKNK